MKKLLTVKFKASKGDDLTRKIYTRTINAKERDVMEELMFSDFFNVEIFSITEIKNVVLSHS